MTGRNAVPADEIGAAVLTNSVSGPVLDPPVAVLGHLLERPIGQTPHAPALVYRAAGGGGTVDVRWTYSQLDQQVRRQVRLLREAGVQPGDLIGVAASRAPAMVVTLLAVLRLGAAYVPLDPGAPPARWRALLQRTRPRLVLAPAQALAVRGDALPDGVLGLDWDAEPRDAAPYEDDDVVHDDPAAPAYVLFTSGSTGTPKGVVVTHANVTHRLPAYMMLTDGPVRYLLHSSICFDGAVGGMYSTLARGGCLVLVPDDVAGDPALAARVIRQEQVTHLEPVPSWYAALLDITDPEDLASVTTTILGGETLPPALVAEHRRAVPTGRLFNDYGPTEVTVAATVYEVPLGWSGDAVPIGRPHANTTVGLLDDAGRPVAAGEIGEVVVSGPCVASGYLGDPGDAAFHIDGTGARCYRTGDLARWSDGELHFQGRRDRQVKLRGQRVEPGELEAALLELPGVAAAAVEVRNRGGDPELVAYVAPAHSQGLLDAAQVRACLATRVPVHLIPADLVCLAQLPLTAGGKIDRQALPATDAKARTRTPGPVPADAVDAAVLTAFEAVLGRSVQLGDDFFAEGGQSLSAARVVARLRRSLHIELSVRDLLVNPTAAALASVARQRGKSVTPDPLHRRARPQDAAWRVEASPRQHSFWFLESVEGGRSGSNLVECLQLPADVATDHVRRAVRVLVDRHASLRTAFESTTAGLDQVVSPRSTLGVDVVDLGSTTSLAEALELADGFGELPFDLASPPLVRAARVRLAGDTVVIVVLHHAVADGWSLGILLEELALLLEGDPDLAAAQLPELELEYVDLVEWTGRRPEAVRRAATQHLLDRLEEATDAGPRLLPYDHPPAPHGDIAAGMVTAMIPDRVVTRLEALARDQRATTYHTLVACLGMLLGRAAGVERVLIGGPLSGRGEPELDRVVGCCINTGLFRVDLHGGPDVAEVVRRVAADAAADAAHTWLPLEVPLGLLTEGERASALPVLLNLLSLPVSPLTGGARHSRPTKVAYTDLDLYVEPCEQGLRIQAVHNLTRLNRATVQTLLDRWLLLLERAAGDPTARLDALPLMTRDESDRIAELEGKSGPAPEGSVLDMFRAVLLDTDDVPALVDGDGSWTRRELWDRSSAVVRLLDRRGIAAGDSAVLALDGSVDVVAALLACWRLGVVAVPVGETLPAARRLAVAVASSAKIVLDSDLVRRHLLDDTASILHGDLADLGPRPAYVLFTSGSTGAPKGVTVTHAALLASTLARVDAYGVPPKTALLVHDLAFDAGLGIIAWYLATGGRLVMASRDQRLDPQILAQLVETHEVGQLDVVPSHYRVLLDCADAHQLRSLELVTLGGEVCPTSLVAAHLAALPGTKLVNEYGPTECTVWAVAHEITAQDMDVDRVPIGRPVRGVVARVADADGQPVPPGSEGELLLAGHLLAEGYLGRAQETAERFVTVGGRRWYRTGDRTRWDSAGRLDFVGRADSQLKVRGYRIEPEEVAAVLGALPKVVRAAVAAREVAVGTKVLVAWVQISPGAHTTPDEIRASCGLTLPEWMVPAVVVLLDQLPETTAGKIDVGRLATPTPEVAGPVVAPAGPVEIRVAAIWADLLGRPVPDVHQGFFALGGHSLLAARMVARVREEFHVAVSLADVLRTPQVAAIAALVSSAPELRGPVAQVPTIDAAQAEALLERLGELGDDEVEALLRSIEESR